MVIIPPCMSFKSFKGKNESDKFYCDAFPNVIEEDVFLGDIDHKERIEGDNGIFYEQK